MNKALVGFVESIEQIKEKPEKENKISKRKKKSIGSTFLNTFLSIEDVNNLEIAKLEDLNDILRKNDLFNVARAISETKGYFSVIDGKVVDCHS